MTAANYIDTDDDLLTFEAGQPTDEEIIATVFNLDEESEEESGMIEEEVVVQPPTKSEVVHALDVD